MRKAGVIHATSPAVDRMDGPITPVWLTDGASETTAPRNPNQPVVRVPVAPAPAVLYWLLWRELSGDRDSLEAPGGDAASWYVSVRPIEAEHWGQAVRMNTHEVLLNRVTAPAVVSAWATMPIPSRLAEAARRVELLRPYDSFRAIRVDQQISTLKAMVAGGESEQRLRAAWRTLKSEIAAFQERHRGDDVMVHRLPELGR
ncbi:hypothetical protein WKI68_05485 [Streptomyces sp. MS1.HAVA.3]|uniref:Uncharacterized protein n=1 Tax=Streptomyces caledonius TaxID=3134107 RepID=A0ABU8U155_9ACTN